MSTKPGISSALVATRRFFIGPWPISVAVIIGYNVVATFIQYLVITILVDPRRCYLYCIETPDWLAPGTFVSNPEAFNPQLDVGGGVVNTLAGVMASYAAFVLVTGSWRGTFVPRSTSRYMVVLAAVATAGSLARMVVFPPSAAGPTLVGWPSFSLRTLFVLLILFGMLGAITERYQKALERTEAALEQVSAQQRMVVEADERARREVAAFLHDQVQARLLVVAMQLRAASVEPIEARNQVLDDAIAELERIRGEDIRGAGRRLSPDLQAVGLDSALQDLADSWNAGMDVRIRFEGNALALVYADLPLEVLIATYRTIEQALLNAAAHGRATRVDIVVASSDDSLNLTVTDNGRGLGHMVPGTGSAFIDAWMAVVGGTWRLEAGDQSGVVVSAQIPL